MLLNYLKIVKMIQKAKEKNWKDVDDVLVPKKYISRIDLKTESVLGKIVAKTLAFQKKSTELKVAIMTDCDDLYLEMMRAADVNIEARKGNYTIHNFDRSVKVEMKISDRIEFDEKINFAHAKIKEFLELKTKDVDVVLHELINGAFNTKSNKLDTKSIFKMLKYKIKDSLWREAMELITDSIQKNKSVRYLAVYQKDEEGKYKQIQLNFSAL